VSNGFHGEATNFEKLNLYIFIIKVLAMRFNFVFRIVALCLAAICPLIITLAYPIQKSLSWYWSTEAIPLFILTTIPTAYYFMNTKNWKLAGICLLLLTAFPVTTHGLIHNITATSFFILSGYALIQSNKASTLIKSLYFLSAVVCGLHLLLGELYMIWLLCLHHGIISYRYYNAQIKFVNRLDN